MSESAFQKTVILTLPPADRGPICSYSPICSPSSRNLALWREATITMTEQALDVPPEEERALMGKWIVQLVHRELGGYLDQAQQQENATLGIDLDSVAAGIIRTALDLRVTSEGLSNQTV